jgi:hypothetical protein
MMIIIYTSHYKLYQIQNACKRLWSRNCPFSLVTRLPAKPENECLISAGEEIYFSSTSRLSLGPTRAENKAHHFTQYRR